MNSHLERLIDRADYLRTERKDREMEELWARDEARKSYTSLGQNPTSIPDGNWRRTYLSGTGNTELWVEDSLRLSYQIVSD